MYKIALVSFFVFFLGLSSSLAQKSTSTYKFADELVDSLSEMVYNSVSNVSATEKSNLFWYTVKTRQGTKYIIVDYVKNSKREAFDRQKLAKLLANQTKREISSDKLPLQNVKFSTKADSLFFQYGKYHWEYIIKANKLEKKDRLEEKEPRKHWAAARDELGNDEIKSPDGSFTAYIKEFNLYVKDTKAGKENQLTFDGSPGEFYSSYIRWSPNSRFIAVHKFRPAEKRFMKFIESSPKDQLQPKLLEFEYPKPGDALPIRQPALFSIEGFKQVHINFNQYQHQFIVSDPVWRTDSRAFTIEYNQRGHQKYSVLEIDTLNANISVLAEETPETFFQYSAKKFRKDIDDGKEMIWMSERDGWNHIYLFNSKGELINQITKGEWVVRKVEHVDEKNRQVIFSAGGMNRDEDPYHLHYYRINFDGSGLTALTHENANHEVVFTADYSFFIDSYSRADYPGKTVLRNGKNGELMMVLEETDISDLEQTTWRMPEVFVAKARDGISDIWGLIYRPSNFDPNNKYPIIEYIYAGPHSAFVPKSFSGLYRRFSALAELGFIVVQIDGMGTSHRSKAFHDVCWKNLKDAGFPDRIKWIQAAAQDYPYMDVDRVGVYGGSAGGQSSTGALLFYPHFYKVAVSACGCHDNRMDKIWWNEQWMGYPIGEHYAENSNICNANLLQGELMLILGEIDDNVDPASTTQLVNALVKAGKEFEFVLLPGENHTIGGDYGERKRRDFFVKHLLGQKPPVWNR